MNNRIIGINKILIMSWRIVRTITVTQIDTLAFKQAVGDLNPIHFDSKFAAQTRFQKPIAHGMFIMGHLRSMLDVLPNYALVSFAIKFKKPIFMRDQIQLKLTTYPSGNENHFILTAANSNEIVTIVQGRAKTLNSTDY